MMVAGRRSTATTIRRRAAVAGCASCTGRWCVSAIVSCRVGWVRGKERGSGSEKDVWGVWATECAGRHACRRTRASTAAAQSIPASKISKRPSRPAVLKAQLVIASHARCV